MNQQIHPQEESSSNSKSQTQSTEIKQDNTKDINNQKPKKPLSQFEISQLSFKNEKLNDEVKSLKAQIIELNDKINEQMITITNNKLIYDKDTNSMKEEYTKEIKSLKEKLDNSNSELKSVENKYKVKIYEMGNEKQLLEMQIKNLESQINELNTKISQTSHEYESQILIINDSKKRAISDYEKKLLEMKIKNLESKIDELNTKITQVNR